MSRWFQISKKRGVYQKQTEFRDNQYPSKLSSHHYILVMTIRVHRAVFKCPSFLLRKLLDSDMHAIIHEGRAISIFCTCHLVLPPPLSLFPVLVTAELHPLAETAVIIIIRGRLQRCAGIMLAYFEFIDVEIYQTAHTILQFPE